MKKRVIVIGTRGIPNVPGGVESHCQRLYPLIAQDKNFEVEVVARKPYVDYKSGYFQGVKLRALPAIKTKSLEAPLHSFIAALYAIHKRPDLIHIHAIGPALVAPLLKVFGLKVVFTHHSLNYEHQKWGKFAKFVLRIAEYVAVKFSDEVIVISEVMKSLVQEKYGLKNVNLIFNGVNEPALPSPSIINEVLGRYGVTREKYIVAVGRFSEEKGLHVLVDAYQKMNTATKLVIIGDSTIDSHYVRELKSKALSTDGIVLTGYLQGDELNTLFSQAALFVLPSFSEGLPIALLEAMALSLPVIVSDIPANLAVGLDDEYYFECGNSSHLCTKIQKILSSDFEQVCYRELLKSYDWEDIARDTLDVYQRLLN